MPIWLRNFTFKKIQEWYEKKNEQNNSNTSSTTKPKISRPNIRPDYKVKTS